MSLRDVTENEYYSRLQIRVYFLFRFVVSVFSTRRLTPLLLAYTNKREEQMQKLQKSVLIAMQLQRIVKYSDITLYNCFQ